MSIVGGAEVLSNAKALRVPIIEQRHGTHMISPPLHTNISLIENRLGSIVQDHGDAAVEDHADVDALRAVGDVHGVRLSACCWDCRKGEEEMVSSGDGRRWAGNGRAGCE